MGDREEDVQLRRELKGVRDFWYRADHFLRDKRVKKSVTAFSARSKCETTVQMSAISGCERVEHMHTPIQFDIFQNLSWMHSFATDLPSSV